MLLVVDSRSHGTPMFCATFYCSTPISPHASIVKFCPWSLVRLAWNKSCMLHLSVNRECTNGRGSSSVDLSSPPRCRVAGSIPHCGKDFSPSPSSHPFQGFSARFEPRFPAPFLQSWKKDVMNSRSKHWYTTSSNSCWKAMRGVWLEGCF